MKREGDKHNFHDAPPRRDRRLILAGAGISLPHSKAMQEVLAAVGRVAAKDVNVMIVGEPGSGKEWTAHRIHNLSSRAAGPFVVVDCAAFPAEALDKEIFGEESLTWNGINVVPGPFEEAGGGTLLLNDLEALPHAVQMKLLRAIDYRCVRRVGSEEDIPCNVRIVTTLNSDPATLVRNDILRKELCYSIGPITIELPPLRKRPEDIPGLIETFLADLKDRNGGSLFSFSPDATRLCKKYHWPGNVRLLRNAVEYATVMCEGKVVKPEHLPHYLTGPEEHETEGRSF